MKLENSDSLAFLLDEAPSIPRPPLSPYAIQVFNQLRLYASLSGVSYDNIYPKKEGWVKYDKKNKHYGIIGSATDVIDTHAKGIPSTLAPLRAEYAPILHELDNYGKTQTGKIVELEVQIEYLKEKILTHKERSADFSEYLFKEDWGGSAWDIACVTPNYDVVFRSKKPVIIRYSDGVFLNSGYFYVQVTDLGKKFEFIGAENPLLSSDYFHPNINSDGHICFGDAAGFMRNHLNTLKAKMEILFQLLCTASTNAPYRSLMEFVMENARKLDGFYGYRNYLNNTGRCVFRLFRAGELYHATLVCPEGFTNILKVECLPMKTLSRLTFSKVPMKNNIAILPALLQIYTIPNIPNTIEVGLTFPEMIYDARALAVPRTRRNAWQRMRLVQEIIKYNKTKGEKNGNQNSAEN